MYPTKNIIYTESQNIALRHVGHLAFRGCTAKRCSPVAVYCVPDSNYYFHGIPKISPVGPGPRPRCPRCHRTIFWGFRVNIIFSEVHDKGGKTFGGSYMERQRQRNADVTLYVRVCVRCEFRCFAHVTWMYRLSKIKPELPQNLTERQFIFPTKALQCVTV